MKKKHNKDEGLHDEILNQYYNEIKPADRLAYLNRLLDENPDADIDFIEMFEDTPEFCDENYTAIAEFADKYRSIHPGRYSEEYEFIEKRLTDYAFYKNDLSLICRSLEIIKQNPVHGIDTVTAKALYQLVYSGHYQEAYTFSSAVWEPLASNENLWGYPELPFVQNIYLVQLEDQYNLMQQGNLTGWQDFQKNLEKLGFDNEKKRTDVIFKSLTTEFDKAVFEQNLSDDTDYALLALNIYFLRYMKSKYNMPFMLSDLLMNIINTEKLFGKNKNPGAYFYIDYRTIDKYITEKYDAMFASNQVEIFGKAWGLHYIYEFLRFHELISEEYYLLMLENLAFLKNEFILAIADNVWKMKFVAAWPESPSNIFEVPLEVFNKTDITDFNKIWEHINSLIPALPCFARIENKVKSKKSKENKYFNPNDIINPGFDKPYIKTEPEIGRNDPCHCGSGKKYKNCCLNK